MQTRALAAAVDRLAAQRCTSPSTHSRPICRAHSPLLCIAFQLGTTAVGIQTSEGVVLAAEKRIGSKLLVPSSVKKLVQLDGRANTREQEQMNLERWQCTAGDRCDAMWMRSATQCSARLALLGLISFLSQTLVPPCPASLPTRAPSSTMRE